MFEALSLVAFAGVVFVCLIVIPLMIEKCSSEEFKRAYFKHLSSKSVYSFGK